MARKADIPRVYLDACIFFHVIKRERGLWLGALKMLLAADRSDIRLVESTLLLAEVCSWKGDTDLVERDKVIERYLLNADIEWVEVDLFVVEAARKLCDPWHLRGADAVHLASALRWHADYFVSNDPDFPMARRSGTRRSSIRRFCGIRRPMMRWSTRKLSRISRRRRPPWLRAARPRTQHAAA